MIVPASGVKVLIATKPVDFRKGMDGLAAVVRKSLGADPYSSVIHVFRAKRADRVKLLFWTALGSCSSPSGWNEGRSGGRRSATV
jgi:transposase